MCGIGLIYSKESDGIEEASYAATMSAGLKHRGPDGLGVKLMSGDEYTEAKTSFINDDFFQMTRLMRVRHPDDTVTPLQDVRAYVHTRYATSDSVTNPHNAQPMRVGDRGERLVMVLNGNIPNHLSIRQDHLVPERVSFQTLGDTETLARFMLLRIQQAMQKNSGNVRESIREAVRHVLGVFHGGYSVIGEFQGEAFAFKDAYGIRPLALGIGTKSIIMASEDHFFDSIGYRYEAELPNGHIIFVGPSDALDGEYRPEPENLLTENIAAHPDTFEFVYLAKRESRLWGVLVHALRAGLGANAIRELLAFLSGDYSFDSIDSVPKGADDMKIGGCRELGIEPSQNALEKILDVRSFMASTQEERERLVRLKFQIISEVVRGKDRLLLDDSIVRGTTMKVLVQMMLDAMAKSVYVVSASPMVQYGDRYGIAMSTDQLVARDKTEGRILTCEEVRKALFSDRQGGLMANLFFPSVEGFKEVFKQHGFPHVHAAYFDGNFISG